MAHKKGGGSSRNGRDSNSQRLGVKKFGGEFVISGNILDLFKKVVMVGDDLRFYGNIGASSLLIEEIDISG